MQPELKVRKIMGRTYLNENKLAEALDIFGKILTDYPDDLETLLVLGNFYLASGNGKTAKSIYLRAQNVDPGNKTVERQIAMAEEMSQEGFEEPDPTDTPAVARLLQRITGRTNSISENDIMRVALLLDQIISSENPAELVAKHLDEIDELMPALIELNIRQAYADGRSDLAEGLRNLQLNIDYQIVTKEAATSESDPGVTELHQFKGNILMLLPDLNEISNRMKILKPTLESNGCKVILKGEYIPARDGKPDVVITSNPHTNPKLIESLTLLSAAGIPIILDLDTDFEKQPVSLHEYNTKGLGTQTRSNAYTVAMSLAAMVSVPSEMQAVSLRNVARQVCVIPDGWSCKNKLWEKDPHARDTINIGWVGSSGQLEDLSSIRRYIIRIMREFPGTRMVIIGSPQAYRLFDSQPENRRMYLPIVEHDEFPYLLSQIDILLVPLRNLPYNLSLPDTILMEASAMGVPWIASPVPAFRNWRAGGIISEDLEEWHLNLRHMVMDRELRSSLGKDGKAAAGLREMEQLGKLWLDIIFQASLSNQIPAENIKTGLSISETRN